VRSVHGIFTIGVPLRRGLGKYVTLDKTFYNLLFKEEVEAVLFLPHFLPCCIPRGGPYYENNNYKDKGKAIPLQALTGPEGSRRVRLPDFKTIGT
jgi:hypothetical protein